MISTDAGISISEVTHNHSIREVLSDCRMQIEPRQRTFNFGIGPKRGGIPIRVLESYSSNICFLVIALVHSPDMSESTGESINQLNSLDRERLVKRLLFEGGTVEDDMRDDRLQSEGSILNIRDSVLMSC
jgi:hypothetical protein